LLLGALYFFAARREVSAALRSRDRWVIGACAVFLVWGWTAWVVFAVTSRVGLAGAP
jgi:hypothetical protein